MSDPSTAPLTYEYDLGCSAEHAFATYTGRIGEWWDARYSADARTLERVTIEPHAGGRVYATHAGMRDDDWGQVTEWEPGRRLAHTITLAQDAAHPSEVAVEFVDRDGGCRMAFAHGGWTDRNVRHRAKFGDWPALLGRFVALAEARG